MSSFSAAGEDLVPEPPLQAQAAGEGEGNDRDSGRVGILAAQVSSLCLLRKVTKEIISRSMFFPEPNFYFLNFLYVDMFSSLSVQGGSSCSGQGWKTLLRVGFLRC